MERCPCCNARLMGANICPRCLADLTGIIGSEQHAQYWLGHAVRFWCRHKPKLAMHTLAKSLRLKQTSTALLFGGFISQQQVRHMLALLAQREITEAKLLVNLLLELQPENDFFKKLQGFANHLDSPD